MKDKIINYSLLKKAILIGSFLVNVVAIMLISFFCGPLIYFGVCGVACCIFFILIMCNKFIYNKFITLIAYSTFPIFGFAMYLFGKYNHRYIKEREIYQNLEFRVDQETDCAAALKNFSKQNPQHFKLVNYFYNYLQKPIFQNSVTKFLNTGDYFFDELFQELNSAKHYIFLQEFMIKEGVNWDKLFEILKMKARQGVEIKLLYDPFDCKDSFKDKLTFRKLENYKIECIPFNSGIFGYESHRKLAIVDGVVAFTGSVNISDIYTSIVDMETNWEISGVKITGDAVWRMTIDFFKDWQFSNGKMQKDFINYMPEKMPKLKSSEFVQPITLSPISNKAENKKFLLNIINNAKDSLDIVSSYINCDDDVVRALKMASYSGVKINIVVSSISDKLCNFAISKDQYAELMRANINILEYTPGFVRSKIILVDNEIAFIGTVALDTRWLNLKYENGVIINSKETIKDVSKHVENLKYKSKLMSFKDLKERSFALKFIGWINRLFRFKS
jgi:cardiolipin synthase